MQASKERAGALVGKREKQPSQTAQAYGKPVAEYDVHKAKGQAAGRNHAPSTAKKRLVPLKEEGAIQQVLGTYRSSGYSSIISAQKRGCRLTSERGIPERRCVLPSLKESAGWRPAEAPARVAAKFLTTETTSPSARQHSVEGSGSPQPLPEANKGWEDWE
jgi:hypothetical protein